MKRRLLKTMVAVLAIAAAAAGPVRGQNETLLTTITATGTEQASYSTANVATVSFSNLPDNSSHYSDTWGWWGYGFTATVTAAEGYTITKCIFYDNDGASATDSTDPFIVETEEQDKKPKVNGATFGAFTSAGIKKIEVYGYVTPAPAVPITVRMAAGTVDAANWSIASGNVSVDGTQVLENVMSGSQVTATYNGTRKVKSVKAVKYVPPTTPLDNTTTTWADGRYAVPEGGLTYSAAITVSGDVTLVLTDGTTLTLNKGISLASGATLTVEGNGTMVVNGTNNSTASTVAGTGTLVLTSGTLTARGGNGGNIGNDTWDAQGGNGGVAINGSVTVSGGTLTARGGNGGNIGNDSWNAHGGNGGDAISGTLTINGGSTSVNNGSNGSIGEDSLGSTAGAGGKAVAGTVTDNR